MNDFLKNFLFIDQLKIMGYGESDTSGCWLKLQLTPELLEVVRGRKGEILDVAARLIDNAGEYVRPDPQIPVEDQKHELSGEHGNYWYQLIRHGTFNAPPVLEAIGTDEEFRDWIREQPSCLSKDFDWDGDQGEGRCVPAHVRRVSEGAGTSIKPDYFCVPLKNEEHNLQHQSGEAAALSKYRPLKPKDPDAPTCWGESQASDWFAKQAQKYRTEWASQTLALQLGYERRRDCDPKWVESWAESENLMKYFPRRD